MQRITKFVNYWLPVLIWTYAIFLLSSKTRIGVTDRFVFDFVIFKSLHMIEYGFLYILLARALDHTTTLSRSKQLAVALALAVVYAISDELHQTFVPTREGKIRDVLIDSAGITIAYFLLHIDNDWIRKFL